MDHDQGGDARRRALLVDTGLQGEALAIAGLVLWQARPGLVRPLVAVVDDDPVRHGHVLGRGDGVLLLQGFKRYVAPAQGQEADHQHEGDQQDQSAEELQNAAHSQTPV